MPHVSGPQGQSHVIRLHAARNERFFVFVFGGSVAFGLRIFPLNRGTGWTGGYQEPSYHLSNQAICVFLTIAVVLVTRAQTRIPRWFGHTHSSSLLRLFLTLTLPGNSIPRTQVTGYRVISLTCLWMSAL